MGCDVNPATGTTTPSTTAPPTTVAGASTTIGTTTTSSTTSSTSTTSTTLVTDTVPPVVTVTANREFLYVSPAAACPTEAEVEVSITVVDPTLPLVIRSIVATWTSPSGPQTANLQPVAGNRFKLIIDANGPPSGELPVTITATAADGASNVGTGVVTVALRDPAQLRVCVMSALTSCRRRSPAGHAAARWRHVGWFMRDSDDGGGGSTGTVVGHDSPPQPSSTRWRRCAACRRHRTP